MTPLRFCLATTFYPPFSFGGDGVAVQQLARALARRGHDVTVVHDIDAFATLHPATVGPVPDEETDDLGVRVVHLRSGLGAVSSLLVQQAGRPVLQAGRLRRCSPTPASTWCTSTTCRCSGGRACSRTRRAR